MIELIGWGGLFFLATCGLPLVYTTFKKKNPQDQSPTFISWWLLGEILFFIHQILQTSWSWPLLLNFGINIIACVTLLVYMGWHYVKTKKKN